MATRRYAARVVVLDREQRVLLFRLQNPRNGNTWWATPGGGMEKGEAGIDAARRELREETGIQAGELVGPIWADDHWFRSGPDLIHQQDSYFYLGVDEAPAIDTSGLDAIETDVMIEHRWWAIPELEGTPERVYPIGLGGLLRDLLQDGPPQKPVQLRRKPT